MRGRITLGHLAERQQNPSVNAPISKFYQVDDIVKIKEAVVGDLYDGNNIWYQLTNEAYLWSGAVDATPDCEDMADEDKHQFLISYRQRLADGRINLDSKRPPKELYFAPLELPVFGNNIKVNDLLPKAFANAVAQSVERAGDNRRHVFVYIHGYQVLASLKLDLFTHFVQNYMGQSRKIAKVIFMVWPAQGLSRKRADDRAVKAGSDFTANNLFETFAELSEELKSKGLFLNLIVHSFGHQLLNGMINPEPKLNSPIFENIFLMAPDVTHLAVQKGGVNLKNYFPENGDTFHYEYKGLKNLGRNIHVFHNDQDFLLYSSTKKFVAKKLRDDYAVTDSYRNLGNFGNELIKQTDREDGFNFISIGDVLAKVEEEKEDLLNFPFRVMPKRTQELISKIREKKCYSIATDLDIMFHAKRYPNHHRYLFTCKPIVRHVLSLLR